VTSAESSRVTALRHDGQASPRSTTTLDRAGLVARVFMLVGAEA
jgi:hypothetical protein